MATLSHTSPAPSAPKERRAYGWGTIIYPESVAPDYLDIIGRSGVPAVVSPLHDRDELEDGSGFKKPHHHLIFRFSSLKSRSQVQELFSSFGGVGAEPIQSMDGSVQYLWHMNDPDKAQYKQDDCVCINGFKIEKYMPKPDRDDAFLQVVAYIEENDISYYSELVRNVCTDRPELVPYCRKDAYSLVNYLKSRSAELAFRNSSQKDVRPSSVSGFVPVPRGLEF